MPHSIFAERETRFLQEELKARAGYNRLSIIRVIWFVGVAFLAWFLMDRGAGWSGHWRWVAGASSVFWCC
jgi:hypothetical protein